MKLKQIKEILEAKVIIGDDCFDNEIKMVCGCDLMSDVLSFIKSNALLLTGLTNPQVVRTAEMSEINCVCFVRGKEPPKETVQLAEEKGIALLTTNLTLFESCGRLFQSGLTGCDK